jgi:hypothetical protein
MPSRLSRFWRSLLTLATSILLVPLAGQNTALAQAPACERYKAELASLNRSGASSRQAEANAQRQAREIERLSGYYRAIGCDRGGFFFTPPAECGPIAGQIRALQVSYQSLIRQTTDTSAVDERRRQLRAAIGRACDAAEPESLPRAKLNGDGRLVCALLRWRVLPPGQRAERKRKRGQPVQRLVPECRGDGLPCSPRGRH